MLYSVEYLADRLNPIFRPAPIERSKATEPVADHSGANDARAPGRSESCGKLPGLVRSAATKSPYLVSV
ncbi:hypothetical protein D3C81_1639080 [compost metagenome]